MLQLLRSQVGNWVIKIMLGLLIISFGIWGIGDIFRGRGAEVTVARVGANNLGPEQLRAMVDSSFQHFRELYKDKAAINDTPEIRLMIARNNLRDWISEKLYAEEAHYLGLTVSDEIIKRRIAEEGAFKDEAGKFSPQKFKQTLAANNYTEAQYIALLKRSAVSMQMAYAIGGNLAAPMVMQQAMFKYDNETRDALVMDIPYAKYPLFAKLLGRDKMAGPTDKELQEFIEQNKDQFSTDEYRKLTLLTLNIEDVASEANVSEQELKQEYETRKSEFEVPESRHLQQVLFAKKEDADKAYGLIQNGKKTLAEAAKLTGNLQVNDLGAVTAKDLPAEISTVAFASSVGSITKPVQSKLGWHVIKVDKIIPSQIKSFADVKNDLKKQIAIQQSSDRLYKMANELQDELAAGSSFAAIAKKLPVKIQNLDFVTRAGVGKNGKYADIPTKKSRDNLLTVAFSTEAGKNGGLAELAEGGFFVVHVDEVIPASLKPLSQVRAEALKQWTEKDQDQTGQQIFAKLVEQITAGKKLADIAKEYGLPTREVADLSRQAPNNMDIARILFAVDKGKLAALPHKDGTSVGVVIGVHPTTKKIEPTIATAEQLKREMAQDISQQLQNALQGRFDVHVNEQALQTLY